MITQEQLDKISDDFQSTFALNGNKLSNCMYPHEVQQVEAIIKKHTTITKMMFKPITYLANDYWLFEIELIK